MQPVSSSTLGYANPAPRGHSAMGLIGFGLAVVSVAAPVMLARTVWLAKSSGASRTSVGISPLYYALPLAEIVLCTMGARRRPKCFPVIGMVLAAVAAAATGLICSRSW